MHHSHRNNRTHDIGYHDHLTDRPRTTTGLQTPHKHTDPAVKNERNLIILQVNINELRNKPHKQTQKQTRGAQTAHSRHTCRHYHN